MRNIKKLKRIIVRTPGGKKTQADVFTWTVYPRDLKKE